MKAGYLAWIVLFLLPVCVYAQRGKNTFDEGDGLLKYLESEKHKTVNRTNAYVRMLSDDTKDSIANQFTDQLYEHVAKNKISKITNDQLLEWQEMGPANLGGRTRGMCLHTISNDVTEAWIGGVTGGLWYCGNVKALAAKWEPIATKYSFVSTIDRDPIAKNRIVYGSGEGNYEIMFQGQYPYRGDGIVEVIDSTRDSTSVTNISPGHNGYSCSSGYVDDNFNFIFKVRFTDDGTLWAGTIHGLYKLPHNEKVWQKVDTFGDAAVYDVQSDGSRYLYIGATNLLYRLDLRQDTWTNIGVNSQNGFASGPSFNMVSIAMQNGKPQNIYVVIAHDTTVTNILKSFDAGDSWQRCNIPPCDNPAHPDFECSYPWWGPAIAIYPNDSNQVFLGGVDLFKTSDGGQNWRWISSWYADTQGQIQYVHADDHLILFDKQNPDLAFFCNDGGVFSTKGAGQDVPVIRPFNNGYNVIQVYDFAADDTRPVFLAGTQDNGTQRFSSTGYAATATETDGDGGFCYIGDNHKLRVASYLGNIFYVSINDGGHYATIFSDMPSDVFPNAAVLDEKKNTLYSAGFNDTLLIWDITDTLSPPLQCPLSPGGTMSCIQMSKRDHNRLFVSTQAGDIYVYQMDPAMKTASLISSTLHGGWGNAYISSIFEDTTNKERLIVTLSTYGSIGKVWIIDNYLSNPVFTNITGDLMKGGEFPVWYAYLPPADVTDMKLLLGTEIGVFATDNIAGEYTQWYQNSRKLNNFRVTKLEFRRSDNMLLASTFGRGLFNTYMNGNTISLASQADLQSYITFKNINATRNVLTYLSADKEIIITQKEKNAIKILDSKNAEIMPQMQNAEEVRYDLKKLEEGGYKIKVMDENGKIIERSKFKVRAE